MFDDDSRGLESPDRRHASTGTARVLPDGGYPSAVDDPDPVRYRLEVIEYQAEKLLEEIDHSHECRRHLREIRAEVEWARRVLCERVSEESDPAEASGGDSSGSDSTGVPMIVDRGPLVTTTLGPDPIAYESVGNRRLWGGEDEDGDGDRGGDGDCDEDDDSAGNSDDRTGADHNA